MNVALKKFLRDREKLVQHGVANEAFGRCRLYSLDTFDRIDLM